MAWRRPAGALLLLAAHQRERDLARQQFVIGDAAAGDRVALDSLEVGRMVKRLHGLEEGRKTAAGEEGGVLPLRQSRACLGGGRGDAGHHARADAFGQAVDRLDRGQGRRLGGVEQPVGMHHLAHALPQLELAGDDAVGADRQGLQQMADIGMEEDQRDVPGLILDEDAVGRLALAGRRRAVLGDARREGGDAADRGIDDGRARATVDSAHRQVEQEIDDAGAARLVAHELVERLGRLGADAWQRRHRGKQRIEQGGAHAATRLVSGVRRFAAVRPLTSRDAEAI